MELGDAERRALLESPEAPARFWALLSQEGFPLASRPVDVSDSVSEEAALAFVRRYAAALTQLLDDHEEVRLRWTWP